MKFAGQDKYAPLVVKHLQATGPHTVREIATAIKVEIDSTTKALHRMMRRGLIEGTGEYRGDGKYRAQIYRYVEVDDVDVQEPMMDRFERNLALEAADRIVGALKSSYVPGMFDPFRVLRAQVGV